MNGRAGNRLLRKKHSNSIAQRPDGEWRGERRQHCEAVFFASLLILMAKSDISFLWPMTGLSFVFATFAAMWFLHERVSPVRWVGVLCIMFGAALISYSETAKPKLPPPAATLEPGTTPQ